MKKIIICVTMLLSTIAAVAQVEDNIWEREENKAVEIKAEESPQTRNESACIFAAELS